MTYAESYKYWKNRYEAAKDFRDPHWECGEAREHREWCEHMRNAFEALDLAERLKEKYHNFGGYNLEECTKYGNRTAEQIRASYDSMMLYEIAYEFEDILEIES